MKSIFEILFQEYKYRFTKLFLYFNLAFIGWIFIITNWWTYNMFASLMLMVFLIVSMVKAKRTEFYSFLALGSKQYFILKSLDNLVTVTYLFSVSFFAVYYPKLLGYIYYENPWEMWWFPVSVTLISLQTTFGKDLIHALKFLPIQLKDRNMIKYKQYLCSISGFVILLLPIILQYLRFKGVIQIFEYDDFSYYIGLPAFSLPIIFFGVFSRRMSELPIRK